MSTGVVMIDSPFGVLALSQSELAHARDEAKRLMPSDVQPIPSEHRKYVHELLDAVAAAKVLDVKPSWLLQRAREGRIHHVKLGKYIRFDVERIRAEGEREPW